MSGAEAPRVGGSNRVMEKHSDGYASDDSTSSASDVHELPDPTKEDTEWQDVDQEQEEELAFVSLYDNEVFGDLNGMLEHCRDKYEVDLRGIVRKFGLDFYSCIKLVNYIRSEVRHGNARPDLSSTKLFEDETYLQPVLEDDAVLFTLDELLEPPQNQDSTSAPTSKVTELEEQIARLERQFAEYRATVEQTLEQRWSERGAPEQTSSTSGRGPTSLSLHDDRTVKIKLGKDEDTGYFESYAYNDIHETMLRDTVRTDSYRDFIYDHKSLFQSKTVLDVGCGTGVLSMFAAKAGAKRVYAVDNSNIINKATQIIADNNLSSTVTCVRGKIEEVILPTASSSSATIESQEPGAKVDILVSEWMGYGLLFESMLDSVLRARDRFLNPKTGLMAPSHCSLRIAPVADCEFISESLGFWDDVYGFDYAPMREGMCDDVLVRSVKMEELASDAQTFRWLNLYEIRKRDLQFKDVAFEVSLDRDLPEGLQAWCIWFDAFFLAEKEATLKEDAVAEEWPGKGREDKGIAFTTGPQGKETHWKSTLCVIDHANKWETIDAQKQKEGAVNVGDRRNRPTALKKGQKIEASITYRKSKEHSRDLDIEIAWNAVGTEERGKQTWLLR